MAKTSSLPDEDHIVRHVSSQLIERDGDVVLGVFPQAFALRDGEPYLSASWLEFHQGSKQDRMKKVAMAISAGRSVKPRHGFVCGNVGEIKDACLSFGMKIRVLHEPNKSNPDPAYTAVRRFQSDDMELLELLAAEAWSELHEASNCL